MIGAIGIPNPHHMDVPWPRIALSRFQMTMQLAAPGMDETAGERIAIGWNPAHAEELFAGSGHKFDELVSIAESGKQLPRFNLPATLKAKTAVKHGSVVSQNLAAIYPGSDAKLKDEYVVMSAHIDHLGVGKPINGDSIYNGAMDNASGVASILEWRRFEGDRREDETVGAVCGGHGRGEGPARLALFRECPTVDPKASSLISIPTCSCRFIRSRS